MKKCFVLLLTVIICSGLLFGCNPAANKDTGWNYIKEKGVLVVGLDDTFAPMGFRDAATNELIGFDIDLAKAVAEILKVKLEFKPIDWSAKELELSSKNIDCIWNGMSATPERQESMALSKKYLNNRIVIMTLDAAVKVDSVDDLAGLNIGTQADSAALEVMAADAAYDTFKDKIVTYPTYDEVILDMQTGRLDVMVVDEVLGEYKNTQMGSGMTVCDFNFGDDFYAIGCRKGEADVAAKLNEAIKTLIDNGKAAELSEKWFGRNIVILEDYK